MFNVTNHLTTSSKRATAVVAVDLSNFAFRAYHVTTWGKKNQRDAYLKTARNMLKTVLRRLKHHDKVLLFLAKDAGHPPEIKKHFPEYKANREKIEENPIPPVRDLLCEYPCVEVWSPGNEADSVIASLLKHPKTKRLHKAPFYVVTRDKDMFQLLVRPNVKLMSGLNDPDITPKYVKQKMGVKPSVVPLYRAVFGDPSDNIKPVVPRLRKAKVTPLMNRAKDFKHFFHLVEKNSTGLSKREQEGLLEAKSDIVKRFKLIFCLRDNLDLKFKAHR